MNILYIQQYFLQGVFNGLLWMMLIYNLFLYISLRDKSYLYYVFYVFFTSIFILFSLGIMQDYIHHIPTAFQNIFIISLTISYIFYVLLMRVFIGSNFRHKLHYRVLTILLYVLIISVPVLFILILVNMTLYNRISQIISIVSYIPIISILIVMFLTGDKIARYFVLGSLALFAGIAYMLIGLFLNNNPHDLMPGFQISVIAQVFIFSLGLSYRYEYLKVESIQSKHKALNSQIDPHFFFNSLSVLTSLVYKDPDKSAEYINQLSKVYRTILDKSDEKLVLLDNELKLLDSYFYLMKIRIGNNISFEVTISDESRNNSYIPPNTLQLLVENAIKHNKCSSKEPLCITICDDLNNIYVKNNVNRRVSINESSGVGLTNIKHRFELMKSKEILVHEEENTFSVALPKYNKREYESIVI